MAKKRERHSVLHSRGLEVSSTYMKRKQSVSASELTRAKNILRKLDKADRRIKQDMRATAAYWNADDWGSISGVRDAQEWVENERARTLLKLMKKRKKANAR